MLPVILFLSSFILSSSSSIAIGIFISLPNTHWFCLLGCGLSGVVNSGCSHVAFTLQKMMLVLESLENEPTLITA